MSIPVSERGYQVSGYSWWQQAVYEETPELRFPLSVAVYDRMRRQDAQVKSVLRAVTLPIRRTDWRVDPAGSKVAVTKFVADELGLPIAGRPEKPADRTRDRFSWAEHLRLALTMLPFGFSFFEQVYRPDVAANRYHLRKLAWRPPRTVYGVEMAGDGGMVAIHQFGRADDPVNVVIPVDRVVAYVNEREDDWFGQSLLRPAYKFWLLKDRALRVQNISLERNGLGLPVYYGADQGDINTLDPDAGLKRQEDDLAAGKKLAAATRAGDNSGVAVPFSAQFKMQGVEGRLPDADPVIRYYDEQIARAVLANFLNLGGDNSTGSYALGETFADFFIMSLQTIAMQVADTATQHIVEDLVDVNFGPEEPAPRIVFDEIGSRHPATADVLKALRDGGIVNPDEPLERFVRTMYGLPEADPATARPAPAGPVVAPPVVASPDVSGQPSGQQEGPSNV